MNNMVRLCFEEAGRISMNFNEEDNENENKRVVSSKEVRIIKNGKPVFHARKISDSKHPENNQTRVFKSKEIEKEEED